MPDRDTTSGWGASGWGFNAREPWAALRLTSPARAEVAGRHRTALLTLAVLALLVTGTAYVYAALHLL